MISFLRTSSDHDDFIRLIKSLDLYLAEMDGDEHTFYAQYNKLDKIYHVIVAYVDDQAAGWGAIKEFAPRIMEVKRMYTVPEKRGKGVASRILTELENWAHEMGYEKCILETGKRQPEAIALYLKNGYKTIPKYGQYAQMENSECFEKVL